MRKKGKGRGSDTESHQLKYGGSRTRFSFQICRKYQGFCYFWEIGNMRRKEGKEEILRLRGIGEHMRQQDLPFFSDI